MPSNLSAYTALPSHSTADLHEDHSRLEDEPSGRRSDDYAEKGREDDEEVGILSGRPKESHLDLGTFELEDSNQDCRQRFRILPRTILLIVLATLSLLALFLFFHPPSSFPFLSSYKTSFGTYSEDAHTGANPISDNPKYGSYAGAVVGDPLGNTPSWAGGAPALQTAAMKITPSNGGRFMSNGTHLWEKTVLIISMDGFRYDYLDRGDTPHLTGLATNPIGFRAEYVQPVFPSLTFPNHWSILTGLYPSSHGIIANDFYDPTTDMEFIYTDPHKSWDGHWWGGEPIWSTAVKSGLRSGVYMWPGPPAMADRVHPTYWYAFKNPYTFRKKIHKVEDWLDMPADKRPHLMCMYLPEIDQTGHRAGTHTKSIARELQKMDEFSVMVWNALVQRNLTEIVDVIWTSDHGMTDTEDDKMIFLEEILGEEDYGKITSSEGWPSAGLRFEESVDIEEIYDKLYAATQEGPFKGAYAVFTHDNMPERYHFASNPRIAPIYVIPHSGWVVGSRADWDKNGGKIGIKGNHGYDNQDSDMHAFFVAHGPFAKQVRNVEKRQTRQKRQVSDDENVTIPGFENVEIYNLLARLLNISPHGRAPNNGTVGFWDQYLGSEGLEGTVGIE